MSHGFLSGAIGPQTFPVRVTRVADSIHANFSHDIRIDFNGRGTCDLSSQAEVDLIFALFDADNDGKLRPSDLRNMVGYLLGFLPSLRVTRKLWNSVVQPDKHFVSKHEYLRWLLKEPKPHKACYRADSGLRPITAPVNDARFTSDIVTPLEIFMLWKRSRKQPDFKSRWIT
jgi:hypothetical protein